MHYFDTFDFFNTFHFEKRFWYDLAVQVILQKRKFFELQIIAPQI